jgi:hypothetical protein
MKTRRNGGGPFSSFFGSTPATPAQPTQPAPPAPAQPLPEATPLQMDGKELPEAEAQALSPPAENPSGSMAVDNAVNQLYHLDEKFQNYHMRGIINAIGVCNSTEKARNNLAGVTTGTFEAIQCGPQCKVRSDKVKAALTELLRIGEGNDALGYIGSGRVAVNSAAYVGNSAASLGKKLYNTAVSSSLFTQRQAGGRRTRRRR